MREKVYLGAQATLLMSLVVYMSTFKSCQPVTLYVKNTLEAAPTNKIPVVAGIWALAFYLSCETVKTGKYCQQLIEGLSQDKDIL